MTIPACLIPRYGPRKKEPEALRWGHRIEVPGVMDLVTEDDVAEALEKAVGTV